MREARPFEPGARFVGRYRIDRRAGAGGMGVVYRAWDDQLGRPVALKLLRGDASEDAGRLDREATMLAELDHPGIVRCLDHGCAPTGERYLVLDWLEGLSLAERLAADGLTAAESVAVMIRVARALGAAHRRGVVHRDMKPANVLFAGPDLEQVVVIDFGLARGGAAAPKLTMTGAIMGTPGYTAPEQAWSPRQATAGADVFSLGCMLYECLTGRPAFTGDDPLVVQARMSLGGAPPAQPLFDAAGPALAALVIAMMDRDPGARPPDGDAVAAALAALPPVDAAVRRPVRIDQEATVRGGKGRDAAGPSCVVLAAPVDGAGWPLGAVGTIGNLVAEQAGLLDQLARGTLVAVFTGAADQAARAARCARAIQQAVAGAVVVVASGAPGQAIEQGLHALSAARRKAIVDRVLS